jgi:protein-disulfide isomerase
MNHNVSAEVISSSNQLAVLPCERDHRQGSLDAKVVLVKYGDYQCPQCRELYALIQTIQN